MVDLVSSLGDYLGNVEGFEFHAFPSLEIYQLISSLMQNQTVCFEFNLILFVLSINNQEIANDSQPTSILSFPFPILRALFNLMFFFQLRYFNFFLSQNNNHNDFDTFRRWTIYSLLLNHLSIEVYTSIQPLLNFET